MADSPADKLAEQPAPAPILGPGNSFASVPAKISAMVLIGLLGAAFDNAMVRLERRLSRH